jgi:uncharacterized membrane protein YphA (DoxX/SURF4 family)
LGILTTLRKLEIQKYLSLLSRVILGGVLIFAGIVKLPHINTLIWEIEQYQILPTNLAVVYGYVLSPIEIILGVFILLGIYIRISASVSTLLVLSFAIAKVSALIRGLDIDICPCFGPAVPLLLTHSLAIDFVMLILEIPLLIYKNKFLSLSPWLSAWRNRNKNTRVFLK